MLVDCYARSIKWTVKTESLAYLSPDKDCYILNFLCIEYYIACVYIYIYIYIITNILLLLNIDYSTVDYITNAVYACLRSRVLSASSMLAVCAYQLVRWAKKSPKVMNDLQQNMKDLGRS